MPKFLSKTFIGYNEDLAGAKTYLVSIRKNGKKVWALFAEDGTPDFLSPFYDMKGSAMADADELWSISKKAPRGSTRVSRKTIIVY